MPGTTCTGDEPCATAASPTHPRATRRAPQNPCCFTSSVLPVAQPAILPASRPLFEGFHRAVHDLLRERNPGLGRGRGWVLHGALLQRLRVHALAADEGAILQCE